MKNMTMEEWITAYHAGEEIPIVIIGPIYTAGKMGVGPKAETAIQEQTFRFVDWLVKNGYASRTMEDTPIGGDDYNLIMSTMVMELADKDELLKDIPFLSHSYILNYVANIWYFGTDAFKFADEYAGMNVQSTFIKGEGITSNQEAVGTDKEYENFVELRTRIGRDIAKVLEKYSAELLPNNNNKEMNFDLDKLRDL